MTPGDYTVIAREFQVIFIQPNNAFTFQFFFVIFYFINQKNFLRVRMTKASGLPDAMPTDR
jgi:hypothetical protein